ncbi:MAG: DUF4928 family protein [Terriglobia bacterium]
MIRVLWFNEGTLSPLPGLEKQSRIALFPTAVAVGHILSALPGLRKAIPNYPGHAGDAQTGRHGDFDVDLMSYHVTANPGRDVIRKCKENVESNRHAVLVVPREKEGHARALAEDEGIGSRITILTLEDFIAGNVIEISTEKQTDFFATLKDIVEEYNRRIEEAETDMALKIDLQ